jgi:hypothetical protein
MASSSWTASTTVTQSVTFNWINAGDTPVAVDLFWSSESPHEVVMVFFPPRHKRVTMKRPQRPVEWRMAADLLVEGLHGPAGLGDITIIPALDDPQAVELILNDTTSPIGLGAGFTVAKGALRGFLDEVQEASGVAAGRRV